MRKEVKSVDQILLAAGGVTPAGLGILVFAGAVLLLGIPLGYRSIGKRHQGKGPGPNVD